MGKRRLEAAVSKFKEEIADAPQVQVRWLPFLLNPMMPPEGYDRKTYYMSRFGVRDPENSPITHHLKKAGESIGMNFHLDRPDVVSSTLNAHRLLVKAEEI